MTVNFNAGSSTNGSAVRYEDDGTTLLDRISFTGIDRFDITGTSKADTIRTHDGDDIINSGDGDDDIDAGGGNNIINAGDGDDKVRVDGGYNDVDGGAGFDKLSLWLFSEITDLTLSNFSEGVDLAGIVKASNFEEFDIWTGSGNDTITQAGEFNGAIVRGEDFVSTHDGDDILNLGLGINDYAGGGNGDDLLILDYSVGDTGTGMTVNFNAGSSTNGSAVRYEDDGTTLLDRISFTGIDRFDITGTSKADTIRTHDGDDIINSGDGDDDIDAGDGNNIIKAGDGDDKVRVDGGYNDVDGGAGFDKLSLSLSSETVDLTLSNFSEGVDLAGIVKASNFEEFDIWTGSGNDTITQAGEIDGAIIRGEDYVWASSGDNILNLGLGINDYAGGGNGDDLLILDYSVGDTGTGMTVNFNAGSSTNGSAVRYEDDGTTLLDRISFTGIDRFDITGTSKADTIRTHDGDDIINSGDGDDTVYAGGGDDIITSFNIDSPNPGAGEQDQISTGAGADTIILGTAQWVAYDDGLPTTSGSKDYALITDFNPVEDTLQLKGTASDYHLATFGTTTHLYLKKAGDEPDELIAKLQNVTDLDLNSSAFSYITAPNIVATAFDVLNDHVLNGQAHLSFTLENHGGALLDALEVQVVYSDDDIIGNGDDLMVGSHTMADTLINAATADTMTVQLPMDMLNSRAQADDAPGQGSGYVSSSVDYIALMMGDGTVLAMDDITYFPWDIDGNGQVTPSDAIYVINRLGQTTTRDNALADFDGSGQITPSDAISAINRLGYSINVEVF
jgi:Ca2+-binding RTX toxin-like protein